MKEQNGKHFRQCGAWHIFMFSLNITYNESKKTIYLINKNNNLKYQ